MVRHGDVWWSEPPVVGRRPLLVLTRNDAIDALAEILVVPATRTARPIPTEVQLDRDDGMPHACVLTLDNLTTLPKALLIERITRLGPVKLWQVCRALAAATDC